MVFFILLTIVSVLIYFDYFKFTKLSLSYFLFLSFFMIFLVLSNVISIGDILPVSDEIYYWVGESVVTKDRYLWILINDFVKMDPFYSEFILTKFINFGFVLLLAVALAKSFESKKIALWAMLLLPYIVVVSVYNYRDFVAFILGVCLICILFSKKSLIVKWLLASIFLLALYYTRWFYIPVIVFSWLLILFWPSGNHKVAKCLFLFILFGCALSALSWFMNNNPWVVYLIDDGFYAREEDFVSVATGNFLYDSFFGLLRYVFAPLPTSLLFRAMELHNFSEFLMDIIRTIHQVSYFFALFYVIFKSYILYSTIKSLEKKTLVVLTFLLSHSLFYGIYFFGVTHQRVKIPFQLAIIFVALLIYFKKHNRIKV